MSAIPLPEGSSAAEMIRRLRAIDAEFFGTISAKAGSLGDLSVTGALTMKAGGIFRTSTQGQRIEITEADKVRIKLYTGDPWEADSGVLKAELIGDGNTLKLITIMHAPRSEDDENSTYMRLSTESFDDSTDPPRIDFGYGGGSALIPELRMLDSTRIMTVDGTVSRPSLAPASDEDSGIYFPSSAQVAIAIAGVQEMLLGSTGFLVPNVWNTDESGGSTVLVDSNGRLHRDTSALRAKENVEKIVDLDRLADIKLEPATWTKHGVKDMGLIADWLGTQHPLLGRYENGEIDDYRDRAVLAVMAAKINRLEKRLEELEV